MRGAIHKAVKGFGDCICEAEDGVAAIERVRVHSPDLVIMDLSMPRLNGAQATPILRRMLPRTKVICFTSLGSEIDTTLLAEAGFDLVLNKQEGFARLLGAIRTLSAC
jgi:two-component system, NarL family, response regulator NreC